MARPLWGNSPFALPPSPALSPAHLFSAPALSPDLPGVRARLSFTFSTPAHRSSHSFAAQGPCPSPCLADPQELPGAPPPLCPATGALLGMYRRLRSLQLHAPFARWPPGTARSLPRTDSGASSPPLRSSPPRPSSALVGTPRRTPPAGQRAPARSSPY